METFLELEPCKNSVLSTKDPGEGKKKTDENKDSENCVSDQQELLLKEFLLT